jgi:hypothetical protein
VLAQQNIDVVKLSRQTALTNNVDLENNNIMEVISSQDQQQLFKYNNKFVDDRSPRGSRIIETVKKQLPHKIQSNQKYIDIMKSFETQSPIVFQDQTSQDLRIN